MLTVAELLEAQRVVHEALYEGPLEVAALAWETMLRPGTVLDALVGMQRRGEVESVREVDEAGRVRLKYRHARTHRQAAA